MSRMYLFWDTVPGRLLAGVLSAAVLALVVIGLGGLQNGLLWDRVTPQTFNEWGTLALGAVAGGYGFYLGVTRSAHRWKL